MAWQEVREPSKGHLLFRYDSEKNLIEIKQRGIKRIVNLNVLRENERRKLEVVQEIYCQQ